MGRSRANVGEKGQGRDRGRRKFRVYPNSVLRPLKTKDLILPAEAARRKDRKGKRMLKRDEEKKRGLTNGGEKEIKLQN